MLFFFLAGISTAKIKYIDDIFKIGAKKRNKIISYIFTEEIVIDSNFAFKDTGGIAFIDTGDIAFKDY